MRENKHADMERTEIQSYLKMPQLNKENQVEFVHVCFSGCPIQGHSQCQGRLAIAGVAFDQNPTRATRNLAAALSLAR